MSADLELIDKAIDLIVGSLADICHSQIYRYKHDASQCSVFWCENPVFVKRVCNNHYQKTRRLKKRKLCACGCGSFTNSVFKTGHYVRYRSRECDLDKSDSELSAKTVRELFDYSPQTGLFAVKKRISQCAHIGDVAGHINKKGYTIIKIRGDAYKAHRLAILYMTGAWPEDQVDHINGDKENNRYANLRCVDNSVNQQNKRKAITGAASGLLGAHIGGWKKRRWVASIGDGKEKIYLGIFKTAKEAHEVYIEAKRKLHRGCTI